MRSILICRLIIAIFVVIAHTYQLRILTQILVCIHDERRFVYIDEVMCVNLIYFGMHATARSPPSKNMFVLVWPVR